MFPLLFLGLKICSKQSDMSRLVLVYELFSTVLVGMGGGGGGGGATSKGHFDHRIASFIIYKTPSLPLPVKNLG